jgi:hypothetical protein
MVERTAHGSLRALIARSYVTGARSARRQVIQPMATSFVLVHLAVFVALGLLIAAAVGIGRGPLVSMLGGVSQPV